MSKCAQFHTIELYLPKKQTRQTPPSLSVLRGWTKRFHSCPFIHQSPFKAVESSTTASVSLMNINLVVLN